MRVRALGRATIPLRAVTGAEVREVYWFVDEEFVGKALGGAALDWAPKRPGSHVVRAVDDLGQATARALEVAVVR